MPITLFDGDADMATERKKAAKQQQKRTRNESYNQRFTAAELAAFRRCAVANGDTMAAWVRRHLRAAAIREIGDKDLFRIMPPAE